MTECNLLRFADHTKMEETADMVKSRTIIHSVLDGLKEWVNKNPMKFHKDKCQVLHLGKKNWKQYRLGRPWLWSSSAEEDLGVFIDSWLSTSQQYVLAAKRVNCILDEMIRSIANRSGEVPLYSALMRPHLEHCIHFWAPSIKKILNK